VALLLALWTGGSIAWAHALLERSDPTPDAVLRSAPSLIHLWFSEDLNGTASRIIVWDRFRHIENAGNATLVPGQPRQMEVRLRPLPPGAHLVLWTSVSAEDGHVLHGSYLFFVKRRGPGPSLAGVSLGGPSQTFPDAAGLLSLIAHWLELLGAIAWVGPVFFSAFILQAAADAGDPADGLGVAGPAYRQSAGVGDEGPAYRPEMLVSSYRRLRILATASILVLVGASTVVLLMNAYGVAGNHWGGVFSRSTLSSVFAGQYAQIWVARQVIALLGLALVLPPRSARLESHKEVAGALAVVGFVYLYAFAASGHAASAHIGTLPGSHQSIFSVSIFLDWLHVVGNSLWFGGMIYIALVLISALRVAGDWQCHSRLFLDTLDRFSPFAYTSIAFFTLTGIFNGKIHISSWYAFFNSIYGRALILKIALIGLMMVISSYHVFRLRPRIRGKLDAPLAGGNPTVETLMDRLAGWLRLEPMLGVGVLLAVSVMFYYPVPAGFGPAGPSSYTAQAAGLTATVAVKPAHSGPNQVTVVLRDRRGKPVQQASVTVLSTMLDMVMGTNLTPLRQTSPGSFSGTTDLGMGGRWRIQILVYRPSGLTRMSVDIQVGT
jgi:copper transport protein